MVRILLKTLLSLIVQIQLQHVILIVKSFLYFFLLPSIAPQEAQLIPNLHIIGQIYHNKRTEFVNHVKLI